MTDDDFRRLEGKVDKLGDAIQRLILIEERQCLQGERIGRVEQRVAAVLVKYIEVEMSKHMVLA
jgi:hypothetical protein